MKTEILELDITEIKFLYNIVHDHIESGVYWGNQLHFYKMQEKLLDKIIEAYSIFDPEIVKEKT